MVARPATILFFPRLHSAEFPKEFFSGAYTLSKSRKMELLHGENCPMKKTFAILAALFVVAAISASGQGNTSDEGGRILALETAWGHAIEAKDTKALDMLLASTFVGVEIDGSMSNKSEFLAGSKAPDYQPSQAVNEQTNVQVYGNAAVVVGIFRVKGMEKGKPYVHRERFTDTWIKQNQTWQCVASQATLITTK